MSTNPYKQLKDKLIACLKVEAKLDADERENNQFSFLVKLGTTQVTVVKGGVNTIGVTVGAGERQVLFPDDAIELLDGLAKRPYWYYRANGQGFDPNGGSVRVHINDFLRTPPRGPGKIVGIGPKGETVLQVAKPTLNGGYQWSQAKGA